MENRIGRAVRRQRRIGAIVAALALAFGGTSSVVACDTGRPLQDTWNHASWLRFGGGTTTWVRAVVSTMDEYHPYIENSGGRTAAYVMIKAQVGDIVYWAQVGWLEEHGIFGHDTFWQHGWLNVVTGQAGQESELQLGDPPGSTQQWKVVWNNAPGNGLHTFYFFRDGVELHSAVLNWSPMHGEVSAEMRISTSQAPGESLDKVEYMNSLAHVNGSWQDYGAINDIVSNDNDVWYGVAVASDKWFRTWDRAC